MQLKSDNGPIVALTCEMGTLTSELSNSSVAFSGLESRVRACTIDEGTWNRIIRNISNFKYYFTIISSVSL